MLLGNVEGAEKDRLEKSKYPSDVTSLRVMIYFNIQLNLRVDH